MRQSQKIGLIVLSAGLIHTANAMNEEKGKASTVCDFIDRTYSQDFSKHSSSQGSDIIFDTIKKVNPSATKISISDNTVLDLSNQNKQNETVIKSQLNDKKKKSWWCRLFGSCKCCIQLETND